MAAARPVLATTVAGIPELVEYGVTGHLVPPGDAVALRDALAELMADPGRREAMGVAARHRYDERFSPDRVIDAYWRLYARVVDEHRVAPPRRSTVTGRG